MLKIIISIFAILLGIWQLYSAHHYFKFLKTKGNEQTSPFSPIAVYFGYLFGVILIAVAVAMLLD